MDEEDTTGEERKKEGRMMGVDNGGDGPSLFRRAGPFSSSVLQRLREGKRSWKDAVGSVVACPHPS